MCAITISIPEESAQALNLHPEELAAEVCLAAAVKLYELRRLSSGAAAALAGLPVPVFLARLADYGVDTFRLSRAELEADLAHA